MADYRCTEEEAARAFLDTQNRAEEAYRTCLNERFDRRRPGAQTVPRIFTPKETKAPLDKYVVSQKTLKKPFFGASALNYMGVKGPFRITRVMVEDEKYFDKLFAEWYEEQARKIRCG